MFLSTCLSSFYPYNTFCSWRAMSLVQAQEENSGYPVLRLLKQISVFWNEFADVSAHNQWCFERIFIRNISQPAEEITRSLKHKKTCFQMIGGTFFNLWKHLLVRGHWRFCLPVTSELSDWRKSWKVAETEKTIKDSRDHSGYMNTFLLQ